ncbi:MAG: EpsG family protein [Bacteroidales bacterium]|jgi:hypothetical protein|nr:EpsG family protein [Bacteroidales bacterium]
MFDFIPLEYYTSVYFNFLLLVVTGIFINSRNSSGFNANNSNSVIALLLFVFIVLYIGLRPISGRFFGDMSTYATEFKLFQSGDRVVNMSSGDVLFSTYVNYCSSIMNVHTWFLLDAFIYIGCLYLACKKIFPEYILIAFLMCVTAFSFWGYGVNGIRNGIATSLIILAFSFVLQRKKIVISILLCLLAIGLHKSVTFPVLAGITAYFYKNTRSYLYLWVACIALSLMFGGFWESFFSNLGLTDDERFSAYLMSTEYADSFSSTGFRWDFLLYSMVPIVMGVYVVLIREQKDRLYLLLLNTYIISNAFWILVIRASFSNRFAYLSWFLYPIVLIYPLLKFELWDKQYSKTGMVVVLHFLFTYIMWLIT